MLSVTIAIIKRFQMLLEDPDDFGIDSAIYHRAISAGGAVRYRQQSLQRGFTSTPGNPKPSLKGISFRCKYVSTMVEVELVNGKIFIPFFSC